MDLPKGKKSRCRNADIHGWTTTMSEAAQNCKAFAEKVPAKQWDFFHTEGCCATEKKKLTTQ